MDATMTKKIEAAMKRFPRILAVLACLLLPGVSHAYTAVAWIDGQAVNNYVAWGYGTQKGADIAALEGCRTKARDNDLAGDALKCKVAHRQKGVGGGAIVCGKTGCTVASGYATKQEAVDEAYQDCVQNKYECPNENITGWWDETGYPKQKVKKIAAAETCGPPPGKVVRSKTNCNNGDCTRTFENGCTIRFEAPYCRDPFSGKWEWKPDGC